MARGVPLSPEQCKAIEEAWILTGNASIGAQAASCGKTAAQQHVKRNLDRLREERAQKSPGSVEVMRFILNHLLAGLGDPDKIKGARLGEIATATGIVIDKIQLLSGEATARTEMTSVDPGRLTPEERQQAARLRAKLLGEEVPA